ncbi:MFS transporter [Roseicyclus mahoneyensis]|jgi:predicted MFS family arabinose efflux permease|uniref:Putative MFS family arabinose efflux permease n=1 Tax=Roseicyclus mahoneyensis TaxID=164332 RepID=A0A316GGW2_9RHOB|nr:MFS transporter [Roseicyclus mahoneyensis]PWK59828.1 putative MFS family arabinose efflux permease [Roseicyclus mahoneyensis]
MRAGIAFLVVAYMLSQFYRAFLAVLSPVLEAEIGATTGDLARASGLWFAAFALMQLPVGWALDTLGPRRTASVLFGIGGAGGAAVFALAQGPGAITVAMVLIGIGCAPILMATYFIFARQFAPAVFGTLAGVTVGVSSLGNILSAAPLALLIDTFGWRATVGSFAVLTALIAVAIAVLVRDPAKPEGEANGSLIDLLKMPVLWPILAMMFICYAPAAGLRGLWISPYISDRFSADLAQIGTATLVMGLAMVAGNFLYGPADRWLGSRKLPILVGNAAVALLLLSFWVVPPTGLWQAIALFAAIGVLGASYPIAISHGRSFCPPHLTGRGVTLLNLFGMGGAGVMQFATAPTFAALEQTRAPAEAYGALFGLIGLAILAGLSVYLWSKDSTG